jgi:hypothetical protein
MEVLFGGEHIGCNGMAVVEMAVAEMASLPARLASLLWRSQ